ncbi:MAG: hypothetical protein HGA85_05140, partial [Nanoarchaeota archaeon]|nr:hypothetical protein [Nanoarchaeota archaeon]
MILDNLPVPPTYDQVVESSAYPKYMALPENRRLSEKDFARLRQYFATQADYFKGVAEEYDNRKKKEDAVYCRRLAADMPKLYTRIRDNVRIITEEQFETIRPAMRQGIQEFIGSSAYYVMLHGKDRNEARYHSTYDISSRLDLPEERFITEADLAKSSKVVKSLREGTKIIIADDGAYYGQNIADHINEILDATELTPQQAMVALLGITVSAYNSLNRKFGSALTISPQLRIPEIDEFLSEDDMGCLRFMHRPEKDGTSLQIPVYGNHVSTVLWQKAPDNFIHALRKRDNRWWDGKR